MLQTYCFFPKSNIILRVSLVSTNDIEKANPSRGGDAKSCICQADAYRLTDRQTAEQYSRRFLFWRKEAFKKINESERQYYVKV